MGEREEKMKKKIGISLGSIGLILIIAGILFAVGDKNSNNTKESSKKTTESGEKIDEYSNKEGVDEGKEEKKDSAKS